MISVIGSSASHLSKSASQTLLKAARTASMCAGSIWCFEKGMGAHFPAARAPWSPMTRSSADCSAFLRSERNARGVEGAHYVEMGETRMVRQQEGQSGIGKSTLATALTERMAEKDFVFCVFDPEGDYEELRDAVSVGNSEAPPSDKEAIKLLQTATNAVVNTQCLSVTDRPGFFGRMLPQISMLRAKTGRRGFPRCVENRGRCGCVGGWRERGDFAVLQSDRNDLARDGRLAE
jgi:Helicase HerA, central domain